MYDRVMMTRHTYGIVVSHERYVLICGHKQLAQSDKS